MIKRKNHIAPWECVFPKESKNKCKPGKRPKSDQEFFETLCLCVLQTGLSWRMVRKNWREFKEGFKGFDINKVAQMKMSELLEKPNIIKNKKKIKGIIYNAKELQKIKKEHGSFSNFLKALRQMKNKEIFKILKKRFKYIGDYNSEYYLHSIGFLE